MLGRLSPSPLEASWSPIVPSRPQACPVLGCRPEPGPRPCTAHHPPRPAGTGGLRQPLSPKVQHGAVGRGGSRLRRTCRDLTGAGREPRNTCECISHLRDLDIILGRLVPMFVAIGNRDRPRLYETLQGVGRWAVAILRNEPNPARPLRERRTMIMKTTRTVILAAMTALSLGIGTAMAQERVNQYSSPHVAQPTTRSTAPRYDFWTGTSVTLSDGTDASNWGEPPLDYTSGRGCPPCH